MTQAVIVPLSSEDPQFSVGVSLDEVNYRLAFTWSTADESWYMRIYSEDGLTLLRGEKRMVCDYALNLWSATRVPAGLLILRDSSGLGQDPGRDDLGERHKLWYFPLALARIMMGEA